MTDTREQDTPPTEAKMADLKACPFEDVAHRIVADFRPAGWPAKEAELANLLRRVFGPYTPPADPAPTADAVERAVRPETLARIEEVARLGPEKMGWSRSANIWLNKADAEAILAALQPRAVPDEGDETYEIGKRDGAQEAIQRIDMATGGDGEYRYCLGAQGDDRHCPDEEAMFARIVARFAAQPGAVAGDVVTVPRARLESVYHVIHCIHDTVEDEGDRMYLGSTNDQHTLKRQLRAIEKMLAAASPAEGGA